MSAAPPPTDRAFIERALRWGITLTVGLALVFGVVWVLKGALTPLVVVLFNALWGWSLGRVVQFVEGRPG